MSLELCTDQNGQQPAGAGLDRGQVQNSADLINQRGKRRHDNETRGQGCPRVSNLVDAEALALAAEFEPDPLIKLLLLAVASELLRLALAPHRQ